MDASAASILEIGAIIVMATAAGWGARRVGLPAILGYLAVGLLVSPFTPGYVANHGQLQVFADMGAVLMLFEVGIEVDPLRLRREQGRLLWAVPLQIVLSTGAGTAAGIGMGLGLRGAMLLGLAIAMSSSVVVVNVTRSRRRTTNASTERTLLGWSVLQDLVGVTLAMGLLAGLDESRPLLLTLSGLLMFGVLALAASRVLPPVLRGLRSEHDLFLLLSVSSGLVLAGLGSRVFGVPLALAAFVSGLAVSEGPDAAEARRRLLPFRDVFAVMFFVAIGTLIDPGAIPAALPWLGVILGLVVATKVAVVYLLARLAIPDPSVRRWQVAVGLGQVGEFSYVLGAIGVARSAVPHQLYTALLAAVVLTIAASTIAVRSAPKALSGT